MKGTELANCSVRLLMWHWPVRAPSQATGADAVPGQFLQKGYWWQTECGHVSGHPGVVTPDSPKTLGFHHAI